MIIERQFLNCIHKKNRRRVSDFQYISVGEVLLSSNACPNYHMPSILIRNVYFPLLVVGVARLVFFGDEIRGRIFNSRYCN